MSRPLLCLALVLLLACNALTQTTPVPSLMNFQGRLAKPDGTPVADGNHTLVFTHFAAAIGGSQKWTENLNVTVKNGVFAVLLIELSDKHCTLASLAEKADCTTFI